MEKKKAFKKQESSDSHMAKTTVYKRTLRAFQAVNFFDN